MVGRSTGEGPRRARTREECQAWVRTYDVKNTARTYSSYQKDFIKFCKELDVPHYPASDVTLADYLIHLLEDRKLARGTINDVATSAVADLHRFDDDLNPQRSALVKNVKKVVVRRTKAPKEKQPLKADTLRIIFEALDLSSFVNLRDYFMFVLCYKAVLRQCECAALRPADVWIDIIDVEGVITPVLFIFVEKMKNDQGRFGHTIVLGADKETWKCPLSLFRRYEEAVASRKPNYRTGFFFKERGIQSRLCDSHVNARLKVACKLAGLPVSQFSSHCLRTGGVTTAIEAGIELRLVARHGNWKSLAIFRYIKDNLAQLLQVSKVL